MILKVFQQQNWDPTMIKVNLSNCIHNLLIWAPKGSLFPPVAEEVVEAKPRVFLGGDYMDLSPEGGAGKAYCRCKMLYHQRGSSFIM